MTATPPSGADRSITDHRIEDDVSAKAGVIVPLSEDTFTRVIFNAVVDADLERDCETAAEVEEMFDRAMEGYRPQIAPALESVGDVQPTDEQDLERVYAAVYDAVEHAEPN